MPDQSEHEKIENLVESSNKKTHSARSLQEAADSNESLEGFYAMNNVKDSEELDVEAKDDEKEEDKA